MNYAIDFDASLQYGFFPVITFATFVRIDDKILTTEKESETKNKE